MNTGPDPDPRAEREARLTALLLGELPAAEAAALERALAADPQLAQLRDELRRTIGLVRETVAVPAEPAGTQPQPLRLSDERRQKLLAHFQTVPLRPANVTVADTTAKKLRDVRWLMPMAAAVAIMLAGAWLFLPALSMAKRTPKDITAIAGRRSVAMDDYIAFDVQVRSDPVGYNMVTPSEAFVRTTSEGQVAFRMPAGAGDTTVAGQRAQVESQLADQPTGATAKQQFGAIILPTTIGDPTDIGVLDRRQPELAGGQGGGGSGYVPPELGEMRIPIKYAQSESVDLELAALQQAQGNASSVRVDPTTGAVIPAEAAGLPAIAAATLSSVEGRDGAGTDFQKRLGTIVNRAATGSGGIVAAGEPVVTGRKEVQSEFGRFKSDGFAMTGAPIALGLQEQLAEVGKFKSDSQLAGVPAKGASPVLLTNFASYFNDGNTSPMNSEALSHFRWGGSSDPARYVKIAQPTGASVSAGVGGGALPHIGEVDGDQSTKSGAGTLRLNGGNIFAGGTVLNPGTLTVNGNAPAPEPMVAGSAARPQVITAEAPVAIGLRAAVDNERRLAEQERKVAALQEKVAKTREEIGVTDIDTPGISQTLEPETLRRLEVMRTEIGAQHSEMSTRLKQLEKQPRSELRRSLATAYPDPLQSSLLDQLAQAEQRRAALAKDLGEEHPEVRRTEQLIAKVDQQLDDRTDAIMDALQVRVNTLKAQSEGIAQEVARAKQLDLDQAAKARPYFEAKRDLDEQKTIRDTLRRRITSETIDQNIPKSSTVQIIDQAQAGAAEKPSLWGRLSGAFSGEVERSARISADKEVTDIATMGRAQASSGYDPHFATVELAGIKSKLVLQEVIDRLQLHTAWGGKGEALSNEETLNRLRDKIEVTKSPTTDLIEIRAKAATPKEAALIANTVAEVYRDVRVAQQSAKNNGGVKVLAQRLAEQEKLVASLEGELKKREQAAAVESEPPAPRKPVRPAPVPQPEVLARDNAFSTFSLNVSDVSFKLAAASLAQGQWPDPASVRAEEFLNAFNYRDAEPAPGAPLAFAWERARAPFAHNRDLLRFSLQTAATGRPPGQSLNVVLVLDNSGSMERADRVRIVREALRALAGQFQPSDKLSVISFARTPRLWVDGASGARAVAVAEQVGGLTPEGGTNLEEALRLGYETARRHYVAGGINHVVLLTDGAANLGEVDPASLQKRVETHRQQGIALDCFGIGWEGFNDDLLETLARHGDGRYGFLNSPAEAATEFAAQLAGALKVAASDVKVQVEFNPRRVTAWRQIGYAKHQLTKEQFRDNTVDAAELAAQESGNALYTVEVNPRGEGPLATVRARFKVPGTNEYREHAWEVPFTGNAVALDEASPAMRLAATAGAFAEWLASSPFAAEVTADRLLAALRGVPEVYGADARPKQLEEMVRQAKGLRR